MSKYLKLLLALTLALTMVFTLAACGGDNDTGDDGDHTVNTGDKGDSDETTGTTAPVKKESEGLEFVLTETGDSFAVTGIGTCTDAEVVIPAEFDGKPVTQIGENAFLGCDTMTSIVMPDTITVIGDDAFRVCTELVSITFSANLRSIGDQGFYSCGKLTEVELPDSVTELDSSVFGNCTALTSAKLSAGLKELGTACFTYCPNLTKVILPEGLEKINISAFMECTALKQITIPNSVTEIGGSAFSGCVGLEKIAFGNSLTKIGKEAFSNCDSLTEVSLPDSVTELGKYAFSKCDALKSITIPAGVSEMENVLLNCESLESVVFAGLNDWWLDTGDGVVAFADPSGMALYLKEGSSWQMDDLIGIDDQGIMYQLADTLDYCYVVGSLDNTVAELRFASECNGYPVTRIDSYAFREYVNLTTLYIPSSIIQIESCGFYDCDAITNVTFEVTEGWTDRYGDALDVTAEGAWLLSKNYGMKRPE